MKEIYLISCVKSKLPHSAKSRNLYTSKLFKLSLKYAQQQKPDDIYILSAKYGLLPLDMVVEPYELTLNNMSTPDRRRWAKRVVAQLKERTDIVNDLFVILAGEKYREFLLPWMKNYKIPFKGLTFGKLLSELKRRTLS